MILHSEILNMESTKWQVRPLGVYAWIMLSTVSCKIRRAYDVYLIIHHSVPQINTPYIHTATIYTYSCLKCLATLSDAFALCLVFCVIPLMFSETYRAHIFYHYTSQITTSLLLGVPRVCRYFATTFNILFYNLVLLILSTCLHYTL